MRINLKIILVFVCLSQAIKCNCSKYISKFPKYSCVQEKPLNKGASGSAYIVKHGDEEFIMKEQNTNEDSQSELEILQKLKNLEYVVQLIDHVVTEENTLFIINYGKQGNMEVFIEKLKEIKFEYVVNLFVKIFTGVKHIHEKGFIHADLKMENVVIDSNGDPIIIDFDLSVEINKFSNPKGTLNYMPPEILRSFVKNEPVRFTPEVDLYSLCVMFYEMYNKSKPYILFDINYNLLMNSEIFFEKDQPHEFYSLISSGLIPLSKRSKFKAVFDSLSTLLSDEIHLLDEDKAYRMVEFIGEGEELINIDDTEETEHQSVMMYVITVLVVVAILYMASKLFSDYEDQKQTNTLTHELQKENQKSEQEDVDQSSK
jgi:serine/threonine protein kinase